MKRERVSEEYDEYEPEIRIWPYVLLSFLIPGLPVLLRSILNGGVGVVDIFTFIVGMLPLLGTTCILKTGEKPWLLLASGGSYLLLEIVLFAANKLSLPFGLAFSPCILSLLSYSFYQKRRHNTFLGVLFLSIVFSIISIFLSYKFYSWHPVYAIFPSVLLLFSFLVFFVTRRTDSTPWYITLSLVLVLISSLTFQNDILSFIFKMVEFEGLSSIISSLINIFLYGDVFWYVLSFFFVFASLSGKSSYKKVLNEEVEDEDFVPSSTSDDVPSGDGKDPRYTYPPEYSRFSENTKQNTSPTSATSPKASNTSPENSKENNTNDKWYEFLQGGSNDNSRVDDKKYQNDRRDDRYPSPRRDDYYDERDYPLPRRRDDYNDRGYPVRRRRDDDY